MEPIAAGREEEEDGHEHRLLLEVCVDTPHGLATALANGADRIELCSALSVGGLTPSPGFMHAAAAAAAASDRNTPIVAMVRPRPGDFCYTAEEVAVMKADIRAARAAGLAGVVLGASRPDGALDAGALAALVEEAKGPAGDGAEPPPLQQGGRRPFSVTLHRAIDLCPDPVSAVETAVGLGVDRVLTSGGAATAMEGRAVIRRMVERGAGRLVVMAGSGVTVANAAELVAATGVRELHASCSSSSSSSMKGSAASNDRVVAKARALGFMAEGDRETDGGKVRELSVLVHGLGGGGGAGGAGAS